MKTALTIAGSDCSGGAGIQADLKTMTTHGVYAMSVVTALTAQNTTGVKGIMEVDVDFLEKQLDCVFQDIFPDAVKIGMLGSKEMIQSIAKKLEFYQAKNIVVDPVMVSTSGSTLLKENARETLQQALFPLAKIITPNIPEAIILSNMEINTEKDMEKVAEKLYQTYGCAILLKGGHQIGDANDCYYDQAGMIWFTGQRIDNPNTHGTGCTLSSAIASNLAKGYDLKQSIQYAKNYISKALANQLDLGKGSGPLNHALDIKGEY